MKIFYYGFMALQVINLTVAGQYGDNQKLTNRLTILDQKEELVTASILSHTLDGKNLYVVTIGKGDKDNKPGVAVIGNVQGFSPASTEIVMQMIEKMAALKPAILDEVTFYFFPDVTPAASAQYDANPAYEREENARPFDDDRDGKTDEDGFDDMDGDGLITWMRIKDPDKGEYRIHPGNPAVMTKADVTKNQNAEYIVIREGYDNDKDGIINEDLPGGIIFNKNFSFNYPYFGKGAGENSFSDPETRELAGFLFDHWNIFAVLCIGSENNLSAFSDLKVKFIDNTIPGEVHEKDKPYFERVGHLYNGLVRLNDTAKVNPSGGDLLSWAYFHYNRFAFSTPAWNISRNSDNLGSIDYDYLKMASEIGLKDQFVAWHKIEHPDFPGVSVEVGGIKPFLVSNPPLSVIDTVSVQHFNFLTALASLHPQLDLDNIKITRRANDLFMVEVEIANKGKFPVMPAMAVNSKWVKKVRVELTLSNPQSIAGGKKIFLYDNILPGESVKAAWLINGKGKISLKAGSPQTGYIVKDIELN
jgi:hypothetical protein